MQKQNLIKSGIAVAFLVVASMFGFSAAYGYGGGGGGGGHHEPTICTSVTYADWQGCVMGIQYRNVLSQAPANCVLTASQQGARVQNCASTPACTSVTYDNWSTKCVLGLYSRNITGQFPAGCKITLAQELARLKTCVRGRVLGAKIYAKGSLIRGSDHRIYEVGDNGNLTHIKTLKDLSAKHFGKKIVKVNDNELGD